MGSLTGFANSIGPALGAAAPALQTAGAITQAGSAVAGSIGTRNAYEQQAAVARNNALIAGWQADDAVTRGQKASYQALSRSRQMGGQQRAQMAANGLDVTQGSALDILSDTAYSGAQDASTIESNAGREAWALRMQASNFKNDAALKQGRADMESPALAGATTLLASAGKVAERWYQPVKGR